MEEVLHPISYNYPQKLWHKPPFPSFNVDLLGFKPARRTRQPSEPFQTIFTLSTLNWGDGGGTVSIFFKKKRVVPQYFVTDCRTQIHQIRTNKITL